MQIKNIVLLVVFILLIVVIQWARGQSVDDIIRKYIDARGGKEKLLAIRSLYMEGIRHMMGIGLPIKVTIVNEKLFRTDFEHNATHGYLIITPSQGWSYIPGGSETANPVSQHLLHSLQVEMDIPGPLVDYESKGYQAILGEKELVDGKETHKIQLISNTGNASAYYIDSTTYLLVQVKQTKKDDTGFEKEVITRFSDYRSIDGIMFPHSITNPMGGIMHGTTNIHTIVINPPIDESDYMLPGNA